MNDRDPGTRGFPPSPSLLPHAGARLPNAPWSSSVGRLFDAVACLLGLTDRSRYEGEAATLLEHAALAARRASLPPQRHVAFAILDQPPILQLDWRPVLEALADPAVARNPLPAALAFHHALVSASLAVALRLGQSRILLTGGCFQNRLLTELLVESFRAHGFSVYWHQRIPPNDGGIALGQVVAARARLASLAAALP